MHDCINEVGLCGNELVTFKSKPESLLYQQLSQEGGWCRNSPHSPSPLIEADTTNGKKGLYLMALVIY